MSWNKSPDGKTCATCRFWCDRSAHYEAEKYGRCQRYPPKAFADSKLWPDTHSEDWCGEYEERKP